MLPFCDPGENRLDWLVDFFLTKSFRSVYETEKNITFGTTNNILSRGLFDKSVAEGETCDILLHALLNMAEILCLSTSFTSFI